MSLDITVPFWILTFSYWVHLISTIIWLGGLALMAFIAWPAVRGQIMSLENWIQLRRRLVPWFNASLVLLWVTGFVQLTADDNYEGFLAVSSLWAQAILVKHLVVIAMMLIGLYSQWRVQPALDRLNLLAAKRPGLAKDEKKRLSERENRLLRLNLVCALAVLFLTAVATAV